LGGSNAGCPAALIQHVKKFVVNAPSNRRAIVGLSTVFSEKLNNLAQLQDSKKLLTGVLASTHFQNIVV